MEDCMGFQPECLMPHIALPLASTKKLIKKLQIFIIINIVNAHRSKTLNFHKPRLDAGVIIGVVREDEAGVHGGGPRGSVHSGLRGSQNCSVVE